jgi:hypothetical protein
MDIDKYISILERDKYTCRECGRTYQRTGSIQLAHRIKQGKGSENYILKFYYQHFGQSISLKMAREILNHPDNLVSVCSLKCNDRQNIFFNPVERDKLLLKIIGKVAA